MAKLVDISGDIRRRKRTEQSLIDTELVKAISARFPKHSPATCKEECNCLDAVSTAAPSAQQQPHRIESKGDVGSDYRAKFYRDPAYDVSLALAERLQREESTKKHTKRKRQADTDADLAMRLQRKEDERARAKRQRQIERDSELARKMARSSYAVGPRRCFLTVCTNCGVSMDRRSLQCPSCKRKNSLQK